MIFGMEVTKVQSLCKSLVAISIVGKEIMHTIALYFFVRKRLPFGHIGRHSHIHTPSLIAEGSLDNIYLGDNCNIDWNNTIFATKGKFIMKSNSGAAVGLTVITNNHVGELGHFFKEAVNENLVAKDIVVENEVWLAANVTLLAGVKVGRGAIVGAGSVLRSCTVPPYAIVAGNPAKVIGFRFTPDEIIQHEEKLYPKEQRIPLELLEKNYKRYFLDHIKEIKSYVSLVCK